MDNTSGSVAPGNYETDTDTKLDPSHNEKRLAKAGMRGKGHWCPLPSSLFICSVIKCENITLGSAVGRLMQFQKQ